MECIHSCPVAYVLQGEAGIVTEAFIQKIGRAVGRNTPNHCWNCIDDDLKPISQRHRFSRPGARPTTTAMVTAVNAKAVTATISSKAFIWKLKRGSVKK